MKNDSKGRANFNLEILTRYTINAEFRSKIGGQIARLLVLGNQMTEEVNRQTNSTLHETAENVVGETKEGTARGFPIRCLV